MTYREAFEVVQRFIQEQGYVLWEVHGALDKLELCADEQNLMRKELLTLQKEMYQRARESEGDFFDDLLSNILSEYADRIDEILKAG